MGIKYSNKQKSFLVKIGKRIRTLRLEKGISQERLASSSGIDRSYLGKVERAESNISILSLKKISEVLGVPVSKLFKED